MVYVVGVEVFRSAYVYEGRELEARDAERVAQLAGGGVGRVAVVVAVGVCADAVDAAEEELFAAVKRAARELSSGSDARVEFAPVPYF